MLPTRTSTRYERLLTEDDNPSSLFCTSPQILHRIRSALQYSLVPGLSVFHSFMRRSHLLPDQLSAEHTGDMTAISTFLLKRDNLGELAMLLVYTSGKSMISFQTLTRM